jgi:hypothetical protein
MEKSDDPNGTSPPARAMERHPPPPPPEEGVAGIATWTSPEYPVLLGLTAPTR